jgi:chorismate dehydratase
MKQILTKENTQRVFRCSEFLIKTLTKDNTITYFNEKYNDYYHSQIGAMKEAIEKYASFLEKDSNIIDFCFGLGYNTIATIKKAVEKNFKINLIALENDLDILNKIKEIDLPESYGEFEKSKKIVEEFVKNKEFKNNLLNLKLIFGNALETIDEIEDNFADLIFFDPFSPKKQVEMWSEDIFRKVFSKLKKNGKLLTYSSSKQVRETMKKVGFKVEDGPIVGRWAPMSVGVKE